MRFALLLLLLALALPARATTVTLNLGDTVSINGTLYTVTPTLTPAGPAPVVNPPPPTVGAQILAYLPAAAAPGALLSIAGTGFGTLTAPASGRVLIGGVDAAVKTWADALITCVVPAVSGATASVKLYTQAAASASPVLLATGPPLFLGTAPAPVPPPPVPPPVPATFVPCALPLLTVFLGADRTPSVPPDWKLPGGAVAYAEGTCFGALPGKLFLGRAPLVVLAWSDTEIEFQAPVGPAGLLTGVTVTRADGVSQGFRGFSVAAGRQGGTKSGAAFLRGRPALIQTLSPNRANRPSRALPAARQATGSCRAPRRSSQRTACLRATRRAARGR